VVHRSSLSALLFLLGTQTVLANPCAIEVFGSKRQRLTAAQGLSRIDDSHAGWSRKKRAGGKRFSYFKADGKKITSKARIERIEAISIPPAWERVWISPRADNYLLAVGYDKAGRKQFRYHPRWTEAAHAQKFSRMEGFGRALPRLRRRALEDLADKELTTERVLAVAVLLLDRTLIRVGNSEYLKNKTRGLSTMLKNRVRFKGDDVIFHYRGKGGFVHTVSLEAPDLIPTLRALKKARNRSGFLFGVSSTEINAYIRLLSGGSYSAKDFRTWWGTVYALEALFEGETNASATEIVSEALGNTPEVARTSYIHPDVLQSSGSEIAPFFKGLRDQEGQLAAEAATLRFLEN